MINLARVKEADSNPFTLARYPDRIYIQALEETKVADAPTEELDELDWLDSQIAGTSKPKPTAAAKPTVSKPTPSSTPTLPGIGQRTISSTSTPAARTTTSSALLSSGATTPSASRTSSSTLGSVSKKPTLGATKTGSKLGAKKGLGATKAANSPNAAGSFEEAAKRAQEEEAARAKEELVKQAREADERRRAEEEKKRADEARKRAGISTPPVVSTKPTSTALVDGAGEGGGGVGARATIGGHDSKASLGGGAEMERLGMGLRKMGFGAVGGVAAGAAAAKGKKKVEEDDVKVARDRFGNQKGPFQLDFVPINTINAADTLHFSPAISSDMYFERNDYDPTTVSAAQTRLQDFKGATSISSNQYFGKPEPGDEDDGQGTSYGGAGNSGYLTSEGLQGLEVSARDALTRVVNSQEVQNLGEGLRNAGLKVCALICRCELILIVATVI